jgi:DNA-directed RNA polymerase specialized sigma24 family protein
MRGGACRAALRPVRAWSACMSKPRFPVTHWTLVDEAAADSGEAALDDLLRRYLPALRAHLVYVRKVSIDQVDDVLQEFIASKLLAGELLDRARRQRGRFRTYLLTALDRFIISRHRQEAAAKRGGGLVDAWSEAAEELAAVPEEGQSLVDLVWLREVVRQAIERTRVELQASGRGDFFTVFDKRLVAPVLEGATPAPYRVLMEQTQLRSPMQAANALVTARRVFERQVRAVIGEYVGGADEVEAELAWLTGRRAVAGEAGRDEAGRDGADEEVR